MSDLSPGAKAEMALIGARERITELERVCEAARRLLGAIEVERAVRASVESPTPHTVQVETRNSNEGMRYGAACSCGWASAGDAENAELAERLGALHLAIEQSPTPQEAAHQIEADTRNINNGMEYGARCSCGWWSTETEENSFLAIERLGEPHHAFVGQPREAQLRPWRVGRKVGRAIYAENTGGASDPISDPFIGVMDTRELALRAVEDHNRSLFADAVPVERPVEGEAERRRRGPWTVRRRSAGGFELDPHPFLGHNDRLVVASVERPVEGEAREQHWIAHAPVGQMSTGPAVVTDPRSVDTYREMGWSIEGPFVAVPVERPTAMLAAFHAALADEPGRGNAALRLTLHEEEHEELLDELSRKRLGIGVREPKADQDVDRAKLARELADVVYISYGTAHAFAINLDIALEEIHRAAMSKLDPATMVVREDGKIMKPPGFVPPDMTAAVAAARGTSTDQPCCEYHAFHFDQTRIGEWNALSSEERKRIVDMACDGDVTPSTADQGSDDDRG